MESSVNKKMYWAIENQKEWDEMKKLTPSELLDILQNTCDQLSGYMEDDFAIALLRKHLGLKFTLPNRCSMKEFQSFGTPDEQIVEAKA